MLVRWDLELGRGSCDVEAVLVCATKCRWLMEAVSENRLKIEV